MGCRTTRVLGRVAIVCDRRPAPKPCACGSRGDYLCDWIVARTTAKGGPRKRPKTCNRPICREHALEVAEEKHLCPEHQAMYQAWLDRQREAQRVPAPALPAQRAD